MTEPFEARNPNYARHVEQLVLTMPIARFVGLRFLEIRVPPANLHELI